MWHHDDWIKTMILFLDGIGILLTEHLKGKPEREDPAIAIPLREQGLLHILHPEQIVDKSATEKLSVAMTLGAHGKLTTCAWIELTTPTSGAATWQATERGASIRAAGA